MCLPEQQSIAQKRRLKGGPDSDWKLGYVSIKAEVAYSADPERLCKDYSFGRSHKMVHNLLSFFLMLSILLAQCIKILLRTAVVLRRSLGEETAACKQLWFYKGKHGEVRKVFCWALCPKTSFSMENSVDRVGVINLKPLLCTLFQVYSVYVLTVWQGT